MQDDAVFRKLDSVSEAHVWRLDRITAREKVFVSVVADVCQQTLGAPFAMHVALGARHGVTPGDIREAIHFMAYDAGHHVALSALQRLDELTGASGPPDPSTLAHLAEAAARTDNPLPDFVRKRLDDLGPAFSGFMALQSRLRQKSSLSQRERAFMTLTVDVLYQTLDDTFFIHAKRALDNGADQETVREAVSFTALFGAARTWNALRALETVFAKMA